MTKTDLAVSSIDRTLMQLSHVGYSIRNSSRTTETTRARRFVAVHHDMSLFETTAFQAIAILFSRAPDALQSLLGRSMVDRYARVLYRTRRQDGLSSDGRHQVSGPMTTLLKRNSATNFQVKLRSTVDIQIAAPRALPTLELTSVHTSEFRKRLQSPAGPKFDSGVTTVLLQHCQEPVLPPLRSEDGRTCRWCSKTLGLHEIEKDRWTVRGR